MKKTALSFVLFGILSQLLADIPILRDGQEILSKHPINIENRAKEYGGSKDAVDAYSDGVGVYVGAVSQYKKIDQKPMSELVVKYGDIAKAKGVSVAEEVTYGGVATEADKALLAKVMDVNSIHPDGSSCDDGNALTGGDVYTGGVCAGVELAFHSTADNLVNGFKPTIGAYANYHGQNYQGLFDGIRVNEWNTNRVAYFYNTGVSFVELSFDKTFRIWRSGTSTWSYAYGSLVVMKKMPDGSYTDISSSANKSLSGINEKQWELMTNELEAGTYKFIAPRDPWRLDSEWYVEAKVAQ